MKIQNLYSLGLGLGLGVTVGSSETIYDNFNDGEDTSPPWTLLDVSASAGGPAGTRSFGDNNNEYRLDGAALISFRGDFVITDGTVRVELKEWDPNVVGGSSVGLLVRLTGVSGYFISIDFDGSPSLNLVRLDAGVPAGNAGGITKNYDQAKTYVLEAVVAGTTITGRVYEKDGGVLTLFDEVELVDTTYASGVCGLLTAQDSFPESLAPGNATYDDFFATDGVVAEPELVNPVIVDGAVSFGVKGEPGRPYLIEHKNQVDGLTWSILTSLPPTSLPETQPVMDVESQAPRFYRASTPSE